MDSPPTSSSPSKTTFTLMGSLPLPTFIKASRAFTGNPEKVFQFTEEALLIIPGKLDCGGSHALILSPGEKLEDCRMQRLQKRYSIPLANGAARAGLGDYRLPFAQA